MKGLNLHIVLIMHSPIASALDACIKHILGQRPSLLSFDIEPITQVDDEVLRVLNSLKPLTMKQVLVLNDLYGATPYRIAQQVLTRLNKQGKTTSLVTGVGLPMLLKALNDQPGDDFHGYVQRVVETSVRASCKV